MSRVDVIPVPA